MAFAATHSATLLSSGLKSLAQGCCAGSPSPSDSLTIQSATKRSMYVLALLKDALGSPIPVAVRPNNGAAARAVAIATAAEAGSEISGGASPAAPVDAARRAAAEGVASGQAA